MKEKGTFKSFYFKTLNFFNNLNNFKQNKGEILEYVRTLNINLAKILSSIKESRIQKYFEIKIGDLINNKEFLEKKKKRELFFRVKIYEKLQENIISFSMILENDLKNAREKIVRILLTMLKTFDFDSKKIALLIYDYFKSEILALDHTIQIFNIIFDKDPNIALETFLKLIANQSEKKKISSITKPLYQSLSENVDIYPELFRQKFDFFVRYEKRSFIHKNSNWRFNEKIIYNMAKNLPQTFKADFFKILNLYHRKKINGFHSKDKNLELALEHIYSNNAFNIFKYFQRKQEFGLHYMFSLLKNKDPFLNELLLRYLVDYIHHVRIFSNKGKYSKMLLELVLKILKSLKQENLYDGYFIIAMQSELKLKDFSFLDDLRAQKDLKKRDLVKSYDYLIKTLEEYLDIIFQS